MESSQEGAWRVQLVGLFCALLVVFLLVKGNHSATNLLSSAAIYLWGQIIFQMGLMKLKRPRRLRQLLFLV